MTYAESLRRDGLKKGIEKGLEIGMEMVVEMGRMQGIPIFSDFKKNP